MGQIISNKSTTQEENSVTSNSEAAIVAANITDEAAEATATEPTTTEQTAVQSNEQVTKQFTGNLLYEEILGFIPGTLRSKQDLRYVFAKFKKEYKHFSFTNEDILEELKKIDLLKYLALLQISKPNKSIDVMFKTQDATDFFAAQHIEIRGKLLSFIRKTKRILKVAVKRVHSEITNDLLLSELDRYIENASSVRNSDRHYNGTTFYDDTKQVFVTHLTRHIPRSLKTGKRWCLVFYKDQPMPPRRTSRVSTIVETPPSEGPSTQMELVEPGQDTSTNNMSYTYSEDSETSQRTVVDEPIPEASLTSKRVRKPEEEGKDNTEHNKRKKMLTLQNWTALSNS